MPLAASRMAAHSSVPQWSPKKSHRLYPLFWKSPLVFWKYIFFGKLDSGQNMLNQKLSRNGAMIFWFIRMFCFPVTVFSICKCSRATWIGNNCSCLREIAKNQCDIYLEHKAITVQRFCSTFDAMKLCSSETLLKCLYSRTVELGEFAVLASPRANTTAHRRLEVKHPGTLRMIFQISIG